MALVTLVSASLIFSAASGSVTRQIGFEQAVAASDAIVIGVVTENPDAATLENGQPFRRQRVHVVRYLEGAGPDDIVVLSPGGRYDAWIPGIGLRQIEAIDSADCRLPAVGTEALLFLKKRGAAYTVASATHGIVTVNTRRQSVAKSRF